MMPGHEDREDQHIARCTCCGAWAAMMPGHEDREDVAAAGDQRIQERAAMMPGHEDREDLLRLDESPTELDGRNDARSRRPGRRGPQEPARRR